ncbi:MAG: helix-turn-helix domain-containing protein [Cyanobium sp.]|nr:helix-turn-helix domain-containing protein [Cyanobium sp.]
MSAAQIPELQCLGQALEQARQARGLSREQQAARLHMGVEQLRALEEGDVSSLPEPVFVVAQARRIAASLGLNVDAHIAALRSSQAFLSRPVTAPVRPVPAGELSGPAPGPDRPVPPAVQSPVGADRSTVARVARSEPVPAAAARRGHQPSAWMLAAAGLLVLAAAGLWTLHLQQGWGGRRSTLRQAAALPPAPRPDAAAPTQVPELLLQASQPSWLEVRRADGTVLFRGTFSGQRRFALAGDLQVLAGRPDLVTVSRSGEAPRPLGRIETVAWTRFSAPISQVPPSAPAP